MAAKESAQMAKARQLVQAGKTAYAAAKEAGVTPQAIYQAPWYVVWKGTHHAKPV